MKEKTVQQAIYDHEIQVGTWIYTRFGFSDKYLFCVYQINEDNSLTVGSPEWLSNETQSLDSYKYIRVISNGKPNIYWKFIPRLFRDMFFPFEKPRVNSKEGWWL